MSEWDGWDGWDGWMKFNLVDVLIQLIGTFGLELRGFSLKKFIAAKLAIHLQFISAHNYREGAELAKFGRF